MASATDVNQPTYPPRAAPARLIQLGVDVPLALAIVALLVFGLLMVFSASWDFSLIVFEAPTYIFNRQLMWLGVGAVALVFLSLFNYHIWEKLAVPMMAVTLLALIAVLVFGEVRYNAQRSFFNGSVQPSELAKVVMVIYLAVWLYAKRDLLGNIFFGLVPLAVIIGLAGGLIMLEPDLSAVMTIIILGGLMFFLAGGDLKQILLVVAISMLIGWLMVRYHPTGSLRLEQFIAGIRDPLQAPYHVKRSFEAFVKGGWFGVGIGEADTKLTGLPVPHTATLQRTTVATKHVSTYISSFSW